MRQVFFDTPRKNKGVTPKAESYSIVELIYNPKSIFARLFYCTDYNNNNFFVSGDNEHKSLLMKNILNVRAEMVFKNEIDSQ